MDDICFETQLPLGNDINISKTEPFNNPNTNQSKKRSNNNDENSTYFNTVNLMGLILTNNEIKSQYSIYDDASSLQSQESFNDNLRLYSNGNNMINCDSTWKQIDSLITVLTTKSSTTSTKHTSSQSSLRSSTKCIYNFTRQSINVLKQMPYLPVDKPIICCIKLLKMMKDSNTASSNYTKLINWHFETF